MQGNQALGGVLLFWVALSCGGESSRDEVGHKGSRAGNAAVVGVGGSDGKPVGVSAQGGGPPDEPDDHYPPPDSGGPGATGSGANAGYGGTVPAGGSPNGGSAGGGSAAEPSSGGTAAQDAPARCAAACMTLADARCEGTDRSPCLDDCSAPSFDASCQVLIQDLYECVANQYPGSVRCLEGKGVQFVCGQCDEALMALSQHCDIQLGCVF